MNAKLVLVSMALLCLLTVIPLAGHATTIIVDNANAAGVGFNDATPATPVAGNTGTTRGQQRLNVFKRAAAQWAQRLNSSVPIRVKASMTALTCTNASATLGSAGPLNAAATSNPNLGVPKVNTTYTIAELNSFVGYDIDPNHDDINANFNVSINGDPNCLNGANWWYGLDPTVTAPANTVPLLPVVFHELAHGLGFLAMADANGNFLTDDPSVWADYLYDTKTNKLWIDMSASQRKAASIDDPHLVWTGPRTNKQAAAFFKAGNALLVQSPAALAGAHEVGTANFGPQAPSTGIAGTLQLVTDSTAPTSDGCTAPLNNLSGKIALIDRGLCAFTVKVKNAQNAGAIAAIIANNVVDGLRLPLQLAGSDNSITIPAYSITQSLGSAFKAASNVSVTLGYANIGVDVGCVRMFAPNPNLPGSSVSHFHADANPDLLMEPALNTSIFDKVDLTLPLFADIDWSTNTHAEDFIYVDGFDPNPCAFVQP